MSTSRVVTRGSAQRAKVQTRAMVSKETEKRENIVKIYKKSISLEEAKKKAREKNMQNQNGKNDTLTDIYHNALSVQKTERGKTGIIYERRMAEHKCLWDDGYPECPERFIRVLSRCEELELVERCHLLTPRSATKDEILLKHTEEQFNILKDTDGDSNEDKLEELSSHYDAIYIHPTTFELSKLAVGSTIELVENILMNNIQNGMAIIRPPGHHAMKSEYNGYCFFNNVAIAAQHAINNHKLERILIVDFDVHHGQGTQRMFYDDPRVVYFSIHRYEHGKFWPNLRESDYDCIGDGKGKGYNFNVPLNKIGMTNADYLAIWQQILIPVTSEYQPELIIVSAGYDAAFGCPEGQMEITPACYAHLVSPLLPFAQGKVAVVLEGGYCLDSLAEGAAITLRTLLNDPCPLMEPLHEPCESIQDSILNCIHAHLPFWKSLQIQKVYNIEEVNNLNPQPEFHKVIRKFIGVDEPHPERFETRNCYPVQDNETTRRIAHRLQQLKITTDLKFAPNRVCYVYDTQMTEHKNSFEEHYERPERITKIEEAFIEYNLMNRLHKVNSREATTEELCLAHSWLHVNTMRKTSNVKRDLRELGGKFNSIYLHPSTFKCATLAVGSTLEVVDNVINGNYQKGICIVRPPGHHAEPEYPHGFCIFNNVALAALYAVKIQGLKRVLIVDWDVHHGNGTQRIFEKNSKVLYISMHRYDYGEFFPNSKDANYDVVGEERGEGFNVNIPWNKHKMGDADYIAAFQRIIMPIAYEFNPELVLVSAGFDAAIADPIGKYDVSPEAYGYFTHWLSSLANGRIILCLEGGYNVNSISHAMTMCTKALLGDPLPMLQITRKPNNSCTETINSVLNVHQKYWKSLKFNKKLPSFVPDSVDDLTKAMETLNCANRDANTSSGSSSFSSSGTSKDLTPGTCSNVERKQTLTEYLEEHKQEFLNEKMYAVVPLKNCPHLVTLRPDDAPATFNTKSPCETCESTVENWICLQCFKICCGRFVNEHMMFHSLETEHSLALSFADLSVWCYKCDAYIDDPILYKYKNLAHIDKFGEELVWSYGNNIILMNSPSASDSD